MTLPYVISPYVRLAHDYRPAQPLALGPCWINDHALHYFQTGDGLYEIGGERFAIQPNTVFLVSPGTPFSFRAARGAETHMMNIHFDLAERSDSAAVLWPYPDSDEKREFSEEERADAGGFPPDGLPSRILITDPVAYEGLFQRVHSLFGPRDFAGSLQLKSAMLELLAYLFRVSQQEHAATAAGKHGYAMEAAMQYVQAHSHGPIRLEDVAAAASLSASHCGALFKAFYGTSPIRHATRLRIERAKLELSMSGTPIKQIAQMVGYDSVHHFSHAFKRDTQMSPALFRRLHTPKSG